MGLIGYGAIGVDVTRRVMSRQVPGVDVVTVLTRTPHSLPQGIIGTMELPTFLAQDLDLVIETAGQQAVRDFAVDIVTRGVSLAVVSVGALCDDALSHDLRQSAQTSGAKVYFPSCAIAGLDRIAAAHEGRLQSVRLVTRKPVAAWFSTEVEKTVDLARVSEPLLIFSGTARVAARRFPESVNVSAALALAGVGMDATEVEVWIDPTLAMNTHAVAVEGDFGHFQFSVQNLPSDNPKSGVVVAMSLMKLLRNLTDPFVVGL